MMRTANLVSLLLAVVCAAAVSAASGAWAQGLDLRGGEDGLPIAINASGGIEWNQEEKVFIASGPAKATQGDMVLDADELRAYYRDGATGGSEIFRLDAIGNVRITSPGRVATGGRAVYDVDKSVVVLKEGNPVKLISGADIIIAKGQLEFWDKRSLAVARGGAQAARVDKRIRADVLTAHFSKGEGGKTQVELIEAFDNVRIDTANEQVFSDRAAYNVPTGLARLTGSVKIERGGNQLNGCSADIDLNTGISRLNSCEGAGVSGTTAGAQTPSASTPGRVHGVLTPKDRK
ncbi:LptA/OstA family protein [Magnetovibrio sp.]|uniref:LptA/OstA family protein n=1 Tax=Magnetovibrio sp. TaxID=2024836 RepID=UPI002F947558